MLKKFPNHGFEVEMQVHIFCSGLQSHILDTSFCGSILSKIAHEAITIIAVMAFVDLCSHHGRIQAQQQYTLELKSQKMILT